MKNLAFDIGANNGNFTEVLLNYYNNIVCFEPIQYLCSGALVDKFKNKNNIKLDCRAISDKNEITEIFICPDSYAISTLSPKWISNSRFSKHHKFSEKQQIKTLTLNDAIDLYGIPDFIKIDIEGYEPEVLKAFDRCLENTVICFEWTEEYCIELKNTIDHLMSIGYNKFYVSWFDEYIPEDEINWKNKDSFLNFESLIPERKQVWGMIYFRK